MAQFTENSPIFSLDISSPKHYKKFRESHWDRSWPKFFWPIDVERLRI